MIRHVDFADCSSSWTCSFCSSWSCSQSGLMNGTLPHLVFEWPGLQGNDVLQPLSILSWLSGRLSIEPGSLKDSTDEENHSRAIN